MLPWIDALRGLAILLVLPSHVALVVPGLSAPVLALARFGQMGVQLFFVASAYTLCLSWQQRRCDEAQPVRRSLLREFLLRRIFRIAPLYWLGVALFAALHFAQAGTGAAPYTAANVAANVFFGHGFVAAAQNSIVPCGWSIGVEMAFYALFPLLVVACSHGTGLRPALAAAVALGLNLALQDAVVANNSFAYFHPLNQLPVFLLGMALFQWQRSRSAPGGVAAALGLAGAPFFGLALLWRSGWGLAFVAVPAVAGLAFVALAHAAGRWRRPWPVLQAVGRASYAIYIVHVVFAWHGRRAVADVLPLHGDGAYAAALLAVAALSYVTALWLGRGVERPGIQLGRRLLAAWPVPRGLAAR